MLKGKTHGVITRMSEIVEEMSNEEKIYVAVGKEVSESKTTLMWTLHNSGGKRVCILHVHQPAQRVPLMGTKFSVDQLEEHQVIAYREKEKQEMNKILNDYTMICDRAGVRADVVSIEMDSIEKGIVDLISHHNIRKLVMGAAADRSYSKKMVEPRSKKAIYVRLQAWVSCQIMFICKGNLIYTRKGRSQEIIRVINQATPIREVEEATRSQSSKEDFGDRLKLNNLEAELRRVKSNIDHIKVLPFTPSTSRVASPHTRPSSLGSCSGWEGGPITSPSVNPRFSSSSSSSDFIDEIASTSSIRTLNGFELLAGDCPNYVHQQASPSSMLERDLNDGLYDQLKQAYADAEISKREAFEESMRRSKAEKNAFDAFRKVKTSEALFSEEVRQRKKSEETLNRAKENFENMKQQLEEVMEELRITLEQKSSLENQIANSDRMLQDLQLKMTSAVELLHKYKKERDELQVERDDALKLADERLKQAEEASNTFVPQCFYEFSFSEIEEATDNFDLSTKIGEGGYGSIYKCLLRHTEVAIKKLHVNSSQGPTEYQQEVDILTKLRHPNLVTLIGTCPEAWILIYEFYPNGSLEDRLSCKDNTSPLSWQTRIRIAAELCSALIFLHSCSPHSIVHGDLKPANILLDANYVCKLSDFGISRVLSKNEFTSNNSTPCRVTEPKGTLVYVDPDFFQTGELTVQSDVYSFGVILLRLLTGRPALGITKDVQCALEKRDLKKLLDPTAGEWPFNQAERLAHLALRCCEINRKARPNLASEVWRVLGPMRVSCSSIGMRSEGNCQIAPYSPVPFSRK